MATLGQSVTAVLGINITADGSQAVREANNTAKGIRSAGRDINRLGKLFDIKGIQAFANVGAILAGPQGIISALTAGGALLGFKLLKDQSTALTDLGKVYKDLQSTAAQSGVSIALIESMALSFVKSGNKADEAEKHVRDYIAAIKDLYEGVQKGPTDVNFQKLLGLGFNIEDIRRMDINGMVRAVRDKIASMPFVYDRKVAMAMFGIDWTDKRMVDDAAKSTEDIAKAEIEYLSKALNSPFMKPGDVPNWKSWFFNYIFPLKKEDFDKKMVELRNMIKEREDVIKEGDEKRKKALQEADAVKNFEQDIKEFDKEQEKIKRLNDDIAEIKREGDLIGKNIDQKIGAIQESIIKKMEEAAKTFDTVKIKEIDKEIAQLDKEIKNLQLQREKAVKAEDKLVKEKQGSFLQSMLGEESKDQMIKAGNFFGTNLNALSLLGNETNDILRLIEANTRKENRVNQDILPPL